MIVCIFCDIKYFYSDQQKNRKRLRSDIRLSLLRKKNALGEAHLQTKGHSDI
jgi:hypothetical protein